MRSAKMGVLRTVFFALLVTTPASAAGSEPVSVPVKEVVLSDGARRYAVPITIGTRTIDAGLDTGSTGLRVLPAGLATDDARPSATPDSYSYASGAKLTGVIGTATLAIGGLSGQTGMQLVSAVGCTAEQPRCAAGSIPMARYGVQGDGLPGEGFKAILGVATGRAEIANPFQALSARRWLIDLPRPGEGAPGRIVFDPEEPGLAGFASLPNFARFADRKGGLHDAVAGCLQNETSGERICGAVLLDSGAPGIRVVRRDRAGAPWPDGTPVSVQFADAAGRVKAVERLTVGLRAHASRLSFEQREWADAPVIFAGLSPYFAFSVLYDPEKGTLGLRPRAPVSGGPQGVVQPSPPSL